MMHLIVVPPAAPSARRPGHVRLLGAISISSSSINPLAGETATLNVSLARPARLDVQVVDRDGFVVRTLGPTNGVAGDNLVLWDGRGDSGAIVPDEAWSFRVVAGGGTDESFPAVNQAAMMAISPLAFSRATATIRYKLPVPSRVHVQAGTISVGPGASPSEGPVLKTIADREPRGSGFVAEHWNGFDASGSIYIPDLPGFAVAIAATPLPENSVITFGNAKRPFLDYAAHRIGQSLFPQRRPSAHHTGLDVFHDVAPNMTLSPLRAVERQVRGTVWSVSDPLLRFRLRVNGPTATAFQHQPGKIFLFIDAHLVATIDAKAGTEPFDVRLPDNDEHRIAVNWRSDYGPVAVAVARVQLASASKVRSEQVP